MMEGLLKSKDPSLRHPAIHVLSAFANRKSVPALLAHLARRPEDRAPVIEALGKTKDPRAVAPLIATLLNEQELLPKMRLIEALGRLGDKAALDVLLPLARDETVLKQPRSISSVRGFPWNARIDAAAAWAIVKIRTGKEPFPLADASHFPTGQPPAHVAKAVAGLRGK